MQNTVRGGRHTGRTSVSLSPLIRVICRLTRRSPLSKSNALPIWSPAVLTDRRPVAGSGYNTPPFLLSAGRDWGCFNDRGFIAWCSSLGRVQLFGEVAGTSLCALTKFITEEVIWRIFCTILGRRPLGCSCAQAVLSVPRAEGSCRASPAGTSQYWARLSI